MNKKPIDRRLRFQPVPLEDQLPGTRRDFLIPIYQNAIGTSVQCPFIVLRGAHPGPVMGICAAIHGNELNGINIIHHLLDGIDLDQLHGTLLCAPVANVPAFEAGQRRFPEDEKDLNTVFPGKKAGTPSQQYARAFKRMFLPNLDYLIDIHTASEGRINSMYVRTDWHSDKAREMAQLMCPEIILHGRSGDGTLRNTARVMNIGAITVEAGNPGEFQGHMATEGETGVLRVLESLGMWPDNGHRQLDREPVVCKSSTWLRTDAGGILKLLFHLTDRVEKGAVLALLKDPFGKEITTYRAPHAGIVIGMTRTPVAVPGTRFCHLGSVGIPLPPKSHGPATDEAEKQS
jgi:predicted deacylase